jgi:hypothetical protein
MCFGKAVVLLPRGVDAAYFEETHFICVVAKTRGVTCVCKSGSVCECITEQVYWGEQT